MANALFDAGRGHFLDANIDWSADNIKLIFVDHADDTPNVSSDEFRDPGIADAAEVAVSGNFASKTSTAGVADAADVMVSTVSGDPFESIVIFKDSGVQTTSHLIAYIDTATGLPTTPNGGDITVQWDSGSNRIFKL